MAETKKSGLALASLLLGVGSVVTCGLTAIPAVICGHLALSQIRQGTGTGQGKAVTGLVFGYIFIGLLGLGILGAIINPDSQSTAGSREHAPTSVQQIAEPKTEPKVEPSTAAEQPKAAHTDPNPVKSTNEWFQLGKFSYRVKAHRTTRRLGTQFTAEDASEGAVFVIIDYDIKTEGKKTETVMSDDFVLVDAKEREFRPSSRALTQLMMQDGGQDFLLRELQPGIVKKAVTAFEVPQDSLKKSLTLVIPEKGLLSSGEVRVKLK